MKMYQLLLKNLLRVMVCWEKNIPPSIRGIHPRNFNCEVAALNGTFVINATVISRPLKTALRSGQDRLLLILALLVVLRLCCYLIDKTDTYCTYCVHNC